MIETSGPSRGAVKRVVQPLYMLTLYVVAAVGLSVAPRAYSALAILLLAYESACATVFVGATRYRIAWDFLIANLGAVALTRAWQLVEDWRARREASLGLT